MKWNGFQNGLNDLLRPFRAKKVIPVLRESGIAVKELLQAVKGALPDGSPSGKHVQAELEEAFSIEDERPWEAARSLPVPRNPVGDQGGPGDRGE